MKRSISCPHFLEKSSSGEDNVANTLNRSYSYSSYLNKLNNLNSVTVSGKSEQNFKKGIIFENKSSTQNQVENRSSIFEASVSHVSSDNEQPDIGESQFPAAGVTNTIKKIGNFFVTKSFEKMSKMALNGFNRLLLSYDQKFFTRRKNHRVIISYPGSNRPRQPFMNQPQTPLNKRPQTPRAPSYYANAAPPQQEQFQQQRNREVVTTQPRYEPGQMMISPNPLINISYWAPYPEHIPPNTPAYLAHLVNADSLFIIQQLDLLELFIDIPEPNYYIIQNAQGQCLYYAYETTTLGYSGCCHSARGFQLHIKDIYHNEIIYLNKPCGCNNCFCCYPVMEVYSPPMVPVGAISQVFNVSHVEFQVLDVDENKMFSIFGPCCCMSYGICGEVNFRISALDSNRTEIGYIRREVYNLVRTYFTNADAYGISFPSDLDVRVKAIFLGALFLIDYTFYE